VSAENRRRLSPPPSARQARPRRQKRPPRPKTSSDNTVEMLETVEQFLVPLVRRAASDEQFCDADVDDIAQAVRIRLLDDVVKFDAEKGILVNFVYLRARWEVQRYRQRRFDVEFDEEHVDEVMPDADELFEKNLRESMLANVIDDVSEVLSPLEADAVLTLTGEISVGDVMKKHGVKRRCVEKRRKKGIATVRKFLIKKWGRA